MLCPPKRSEGGSRRAGYVQRFDGVFMMLDDLSATRNGRPPDAWPVIWEGAHSSAPQGHASPITSRHIPRPEGPSPDGPGKFRYIELDRDE